MLFSSVCLGGDVCGTDEPDVIGEALAGRMLSGAGGMVLLELAAVARSGS